MLCAHEDHPINIVYIKMYISFIVVLFCINYLLSKIPTRLRLVLNIYFFVAADEALTLTLTLTHRENPGLS